MERKSEVKGAVVGESQKRAREETNVTEEEVEEFLAILKRINVAVNYFKKGNRDIRNLTDLRMVEDSLNVEVNDGENVGLDLNADPDTGSDPSKLILPPKYLASLSKEVRIRRTEMERKSEVKGAVVGESQKRAREETNVTEEEVEEFLAILKRINVAVNYFKKGNRDIRNLTDLRMVEDSLNVEVNDGENVGLDLNADPDTGSDPF
ncbi:hypothetical protein GOBAR_DD22418 [Gossypium barbadense]|nr:hypothetical protein GOBAR_DD22418 [Gossypium barbadense]